MGDVIDIIVNLDAKGFEKGSKQLKGAIKSMGTSAKQIGRMAKSAVKSIIGIGSAYMIISKAVSTYMAQNEKLSAQMNGVWTALGNLLGPIIERIIGWVTTAVSYLLSFMRLLGITAKSASQLSKSAKSAGSEMKKTIAGFDELNTLSDNSSSGGANGQLKDVDPTEFMKKIQELIAGKKWRELGRTIGTKITEFIVGIPKKISELIRKVNWKEVGRAIVGIIKGLFAGISIRDIMDALVTLAHDIWNAFLDALWGAMDDGSGQEPPIVESLRKLGDAIERLYNTIMDHWETDIKPLFKEAWDNVIGPFLNWLIETALPWLIDRITDVVNFISDHWTEIEPILGAIVAGIAAFKLVELFQNIGNIATLIGGKLFGGIKALWALIAANPIAAIIAVVVALVVLIATKGDEIQALLQKLDDWLQGVFAKDWTEVFGPVLGNILNGFFDTIKSVWDGIKKVFDGIIDFIRGVFTGDWERAWKGVKEIFGGIMQTLVAVMKAPLNSIISLINGAIGGINSLITKLNNGVGRVLGFSIGQIGTIPLLAKGGVLEKGQIGLLEGNGAEAVVPLEKNTQWINKVAESMLERLSSKQYHISNEPASIDAIAERVAFRLPHVANGTTTPYSVAASDTYNSSTGGETEILRLLEEFYDLFLRFVEDMENFELVAQFDDLRALARRITKEQKRQQITEGR